jgi:flagellum-specific peptidoglycan hydrolase FlgJ
MTREVFLTQIVRAAESVARAGHAIHPQATAAHAAVESAFGTSQLATRGMNLWGVKATGQRTAFWDGRSVTMRTWEVVDGQRVDIDAAFRAYESWAQAIGDYADIISRVYPSAVAGADRDLPFLAGLFLTGPRKWATDPLAFSKSAQVIAQHAGVLYDRDGELRHAHTLVLHGLRVADRWAAISKEPVVLRGEFAYRARGDKVDLRRIR